MTEAAEKVELQGYTLNGLAREALDAHGGSIDDAVGVLVERLFGDRALLRAVIRDAVRVAIDSRIRHHMRDDRKSLIRVQNTRIADADLRERVPTRGSVIALSSGLSRALLNFRLSDGTALRDATREQVLAQADRYGSLATDSSHKEKWLRAVGQSVPNGKRVCDVMDDDRAAELFRETA